MIWSLFKNSEPLYTPNLSEQYLIHDGIDYRFNEDTLEKFRSEEPKLKDHLEKILELNSLVNDVLILNFVIGREDDRFVNTICEFTFRDEQTIFFRSTKIAFEDARTGEMQFLSEEIEKLFLPYLLCLHGAIRELYIRVLEKQEIKRQKDKESIMESLKNDLASLTYKTKK